MPLKVELKPGERLIIGNCVITNSDQRTRLYIDGNYPVLREKDILPPESADTPAKQLYVAVQEMYLGQDDADDGHRCAGVRERIVASAPETAEILAAIDQELAAGTLYRALKAIRRLIDYERAACEMPATAEPETAL